MSAVQVIWLQKGQFVGVDSSRHSVVVSRQDEENAIGVKPSDLLLIALASCTAVDVVEILRKKRARLEGLEIGVEGAQDPDPPWTFRSIHLKYRLRGKGLIATDVARAIELAESKYCSVSASVKPTVQVSYEFEILDEG